MSQPIHASRSAGADTPSTSTPSGSPPQHQLPHHHQHQHQNMPGHFHHLGPFAEGRIQQLLSNFDIGIHSGWREAHGYGSGAAGWKGEDIERRKSMGDNLGESSTSNARRTSMSFFPNLTLSRPQSFSYHPATTPGGGAGIYTGGQPMTKSSSASSTSSSVAVPESQPKRSQTPVDADGRRHYDPSREPKLLHFM